MKKFLLFLALTISASFAVGEIIDLTGRNYYPPIEGTNIVGAPNFATATTLDAVDEKIGFLFQWTSTDTARSIARLWVRAAAINAPGSQFDVNFVEMSTTTGLPTDTFVCVGSSTSLFLGALDDNTMQESEIFPGNCKPDYGDFVALVINTTSTIGATGFSLSVSDWGSTDFPSAISSNSTSGWAKAAVFQNFAIELDDGSFLKNQNALLYQTFTTTSTAVQFRYQGNKFTPRFGMRVVGAAIIADTDVSMRIGLYSGGTEVTGIDISTSMRTTGNSTFIQFYFPQTTWIDANETFYIAGSTTSTGTSGFYIYESSKTANLETYAEGTRVRMVRAPPTLASESDWDVQDVLRLSIYAIYDQMEVGSGGGGQRATGYIGP